MKIERKDYNEFKPVKLEITIHSKEEYDVLFNLSLKNHSVSNVICNSYEKEFDILRDFLNGLHSCLKKGQ